MANTHVTRLRSGGKDAILTLQLEWLDFVSLDQEEFEYIMEIVNVIRDYEGKPNLGLANHDRTDIIAITR